MAGTLRKLLTLIASTPDYAIAHSDISLVQRTVLLPILSSASAVYSLSLATRRLFYQLGIFRKHRLPVPVVSVGNLTWGGNGKTPMVEFLSRFFVSIGAPPLILTRGYGSGDEVNMLQRHVCQSPVKIGVGANRAAVASCFFDKYGYMDFLKTSAMEDVSSFDKSGLVSNGSIGAILLDDGMQHWSLSREVDIVMINSMNPWGNNHLLPRGPLREPVDALKRADIAVLHHANLVSNADLKIIESVIRKVTESLPVFYSRLAPLYFFEVNTIDSKLPLSFICDMAVLCVSAIGFPNAFIQVIEKIEPLYIDRVDLSDHQFIQANDIEVIKDKLKKIKMEFGKEAAVVVTEKDYDRDPRILEGFHAFTKVLVLCSSLEILPLSGQTEEKLKGILKEVLKKKYRQFA